MIIEFFAEIFVALFGWVVSFFPSVPVVDHQWDAIAEMFRTMHRVVDINVLFANWIVITAIVNTLILKNIIVWILKQVRLLKA